MKCWILGAALTILLASTSVRANDLSDCKSVTAPDRIVSACTSVIVRSAGTYGDVTLAYYRRGWAHATMRQYDAAVGDFNRVLERDQKYHLALYMRGWTLIEQRHYDAAIIDLSAAIEISQSAMYYMQRGVAYARSNRYQQAIVDYTRAIGLQPVYPLAYLNRGIAYSAIGNPPAAITDFGTAISQDPKSSPSYALRGRLLANAGRYGEALGDFNEAIRLDPAAWEAYFDRARLYMFLDRYDEAIRDSTASLAIREEGNVYANRGLQYLKKGNDAAALRDLDRSITLLPESQYPRYSRALIHGMRGDFGAAERDIAVVLRVAPNVADHIYLHSAILYALQRNDEALAEYQHAIDIAPMVKNYPAPESRPFEFLARRPFQQKAVPVPAPVNVPVVPGRRA